MFVSIYSSLFWQQFGKAIVCSDAAAEAARYGFTAVDRPEGFLVLAIASLGNEITEFKSPPEVSKLDLLFPNLFSTLWTRNNYFVFNIIDTGHFIFGGKEAWSEGTGEEENR